MDVLYVTSFTPEMYRVTGVHLLRSFLATNTDGRLLVCHEGDVPALPRASPDRIRLYDLERSSFLEDWLHSNRDIIPPALGGTAPACRCDGPDDSWSGHHAGCVFHWFNKNASRWFRKIVSLEYALSTTSCDAIVWVDADCYFMKRLPASVLAALLEDTSVLYHKSPERTVLESGVMAFKCDGGGQHFLMSVIERFRSGTFRHDLRWDDGYQFQMVVDASPEIRTRDLATTATAADGLGHVLVSSPLGQYMKHFKGIHANLGLMV